LFAKWQFLRRLRIREKAAHENTIVRRLFGVNLKANSIDNTGQALKSVWLFGVYIIATTVTTCVKVKARIDEIDAK